ncbi:MAG: diguanylate cyclase (GGDEF)-like protein/PAS domain S-box-containing protein [Oceanicoccus sp.]|jgi:diguanylate cyclase (GGDEF)-like protein/PAS domain S-box-containing protein
MKKNKRHTEKDTLSYVYNVIHEGVWDWDANSGRVVRSPGWFSMLGYEFDSFERSVFTWENLIHPDDYPRVMTVFDEYISGRSDAYQVEYRCKKEDGHYLWIHDHGKIVERNDDGSISRMVGAHASIHEYKLLQEALERQNKMLLEDNFNLENIVQQRAEELEKINIRLEQQITQAKHDAHTDILTSLFNRRKFEEELAREISRSKRYLTPLSLLLFDADYFKDINDQYGHSVGDKVLQVLAKVISNNNRSSDICARWGGEEFVVILPETNIRQARVIAEKKRLMIANESFDGKINISCSIGVTEFKKTDDFDSFIKRLDLALYEAKNSGRNCVKYLN